MHVILEHVALWLMAQSFTTIIHFSIHAELNKVVHLHTLAGRSAEKLASYAIEPRLPPEDMANTRCVARTAADRSLIRRDNDALMAITFSARYFMCLLDPELKTDRQRYFERFGLWEA